MTPSPLISNVTRNISFGRPLTLRSSSPCTAPLLEPVDGEMNLFGGSEAGIFGLGNYRLRMFPSLVCYQLL